MEIPDRDASEPRRKLGSFSPPLPFRKPETVSGRPGINTNRSNYAVFEPDDAPIKPSSPVKRSTLPSGAALAAPFEPRSMSGKHNLLADEDRDVVNNGQIFNRDGRKEREARLLSAGAGSWNNWGFRGAKEHSNPYAAGTQSVYGRDDLRDLGPLGRPYLVGRLPPGMDPKTAKDADYVYERELTDDETRSRYLYWGKAPLYTRQGLPKYDGKHFYPASPVQRPSDFVESRVPTLTRDIDFDFENLWDKEGDFFPTTPVKESQLGARPMHKENTPPVSAVRTLGFEFTDTIRHRLRLKPRSLPGSLLSRVE